VRDHLDRMGDAAVAVVTFAAPDRLAAYRDHLGLPFPILADPDLVVYGMLGIGRGSTREVWSLGTLRLYARLVRSGRRLQRTTEDVRQLGADVVIGRDGRVRYLARPSSPDARPPIADLLAALD